jgi:two-component sensor histidine kinase
MAAWHLDISSGLLVVEDGELLPDLVKSDNHLKALFAAMAPSAVFQLTRMIQASREHMAPLDFEFELFGRAQPVWLSMHGRFVPSTQSANSRVFGVICDITGRKLIEERRNLLVGEIAHRGKNLLAVVQAIAAITITGDAEPVEASEKFQERLATLGRSHSLLTDKDWYGVPLDEIVKLEFGKFADRASIDVVGVILNPSAAQNCALVFHELITNAVKYGALSVPSGHVTVRGYQVQREDEDCIQLEWKEKGGPVVRPPTHQGFGSILLHRLVSGFDTDGKLIYEPDGLMMEVAMPLTMIQPTEAAVGKRQTA